MFKLFENVAIETNVTGVIKIHAWLSPLAVKKFKVNPNYIFRKKEVQGFVGDIKDQPNRGCKNKVIARVNLITLQGHEK